MIRSINTWECHVKDDEPFDQSLFDTSPIPVQPVTLISSRTPLTRIRFTPDVPLNRYYATPGTKIPGFSEPTEVIGWPGALLPGAPASLASEFETLVHPPRVDVKRSRSLRPTWTGMAVVGTVAYLAGVLVSGLTGPWF